MINAIIEGANIGRGFVSAVGNEVFAAYLYRESLKYYGMQEPPLAPKSSPSSYMFEAAIGVGAITSVLAPFAGVDRQFAANIASSAVVVLGMTLNYDEILVPVAKIGSAIVTIQFASYIGKGLFNFSRALGARVYNRMAGV